MTALPFVDEHHVVVAGSAAQVWERLIQLLPGFASGGPLVHVLGTRPRYASGTIAAEGSTLAGFKVERSVPGQLLVLTGRHRFSRYALTFTLTAQGGETLLAARTNAAFPGVHGFFYRQLVIGSGAHRVLVKRFLNQLRQEAMAR